MPKLSIWNSGRRQNDYKYLDGVISEYFDMGGTAVYVHRYQGTYDDKGNPVLDITKIQDKLFQENRDRIYDEDIIELRGIYQIQDSDFDLRQFGIFLSNDDVFLEFHLGGMFEQLGRKLMSGDVLELPHQREDMFLDESLAANKYYVVTDANRASDGYSQTWYPHVWRVRCEPITDAQEYRSVLTKQAEDRFGLQYDTESPLLSILSNKDKVVDMNEDIVDQAEISVPKRNFDTQQFWILPGSEYGKEYAWVYAGDGVPPNGAVLAYSGNNFPPYPNEDDYCLRLDYEPPVLHQRKGSKWKRVEIDYRGSDWGMRHRLIDGFINNNKETTFDDGTVQPEKQALSKVVKPTTDF